LTGDSESVTTYTCQAQGINGGGSQSRARAVTAKGGVPLPNILISETVSYADLLTFCRQNRKFTPELVLRAKARLLADYFNQHHIQAAVIGVSGGIDSAVALGILNLVKQQKQSCFNTVLPLIMPIHGVGASQQQQACQRARAVIEAFQLQAFELDLTDAHSALRQQIDTTIGIRSEAWAAGQLVPTLRSPVLYYVTSLLQQSGKTAIVCGTINRDEGAYLGFFGKSSDAMTDIQIISDCHKSEVYQLAHLLDVPTCIIEATPSGDTYDGKTDEEMIGVDYDFIELYLNMRCYNQHWQQHLLKKLSPDIRALFHKKVALLEQRHAVNQHKYLDGTCGIHFDVMQRAVPGGWKEASVPTPALELASRLQGFFLPPENYFDSFIMAMPTPPRCTALFTDTVYRLEALITPAEVEVLKALSHSPTEVAANLNGKPLREGETIGSYRSTFVSQTLADAIFQRLCCSELPQLKSLDEYSHTDGNEHPWWRMCGVNPVFRIIRSTERGTVVPHYDAGFDYGNQRHHTLMSLLIYLTDSTEAEGGATRLLHDSQRYLPYAERDYSDPVLPVNHSLHDEPCQSGNALLFNHRLLHSATPWHGNHDRLVLRTDIVFTRCGTETAIERQGATEVTRFTKEFDPFYQSAARILSSEAMREAGFADNAINNRAISDLTLNNLLTPFDKVLEQIGATTVKNHKRAIVLLSSGGFAPVHQGHIEMMHRARQCLETQGEWVIGGYLSPDHHDYVREKGVPSHYTAAQRLAELESIVQNSDWLMVDSWLLSLTQPVNCTIAVERLSAYLARHLKIALEIEVWYVCGADNARLALAFSQRGGCVIVPRTGYENLFIQYQQHPHLRHRSRIVFAKTDAPPRISSSEVRQRPLWHQHNTREASQSLIIQARDDLEWSTQHWRKHCSATLFTQAIEDLRQGLLNLLRQHTQSYNKVNIELISLQQQQKMLESLCPQYPVISLDVCIPGQYNLHLSRVFTLGSSRTQCHQYAARPEAIALSQQVKQIPSGKMLLLDDDIYTGQSIQYAKSLLENHCHIADTISLMPRPAQASQASVHWEVLDLRDFLLGSFYGGLVVRMPNHTLARAPYCLPYGRPAKRISLPVTAEHSFSLALWQLNLDFFNRLDTPLCIRHLAAPAQTLALYLGFDLNTTAAEYCSWHAQNLKQVLDYD